MPATDAQVSVDSEHFVSVMGHIAKLETKRDALSTEWRVVQQKLNDTQAEIDRLRTELAHARAKLRTTVEMP